MLVHAVSGYDRWLTNPSAFNRIHRASVECRIHGALSLADRDYRERLEFLRQKYPPFRNGPRPSDVLLPFLDLLFALDFPLLAQHTSFSRFLGASRRAGAVDRDALAALGLSPPPDADRLLYAVTRMHGDEDDSMAATFLGAPSDFLDRRADFWAHINALNSQMPVVLAVEAQQRRTLLRVHGDRVQQLNDRTFGISVTFLEPQCHMAVMIVERVPDVRRARTWDHSVNHISRLMLSDYNVRRRVATQTASWSCDVGDRYFVSEMPGREVFTLASIKRESLAAVTKREYWTLRGILAAGWGAFSVVRRAFSLPAPRSDSVLIGGCCFRHSASEFAVPAAVVRAPLELPDAIALGSGARGIAVIAAAAAAQALVRELERFRGFCERVIADEQRTFRAVAAARDQIDAALLEIAPPVGPTAEPAHSCTWLSRLLANEPVVPLAAEIGEVSPEAMFFGEEW
jgi:hypothetical protein